MTFVYLDTETTGLDPTRHQVWEIAYAVNDGPIRSSIVRHRLDNAHPFALSLNGYHDRYWSDASTSSERDAVEADLIRALDGATIVGANPGFDAGFLRARWGETPWHHRTLDIESYARPWAGEDDTGPLLGLNAIRNKLRDQGWPIPVPDHTAAKDVEVLRECHRALRDYYKRHLS